MKMTSNAEEFDQIAREIFAPIYPVIARQMLEQAGFSNGKCLDLGCGSGYLGIALAELSHLDVLMLDNDPAALVIARRNLEERALTSRVKLVRGDVHDIPLESGTVNLVVSRGSMYFWDDKVKAFREIYRVLAPGGMACIGGGFGSPELKEQIDREMLRRDPEWHENTRRRMGSNTADKYGQILEEAGIPNYEFDYGPAGRWIVIKKDNNGTCRAGGGGVAGP